MKWVEQEWAQNPAAARSNLMTRVDKATPTSPACSGKAEPV